MLYEVTVQCLTKEAAFIVLQFRDFLLRKRQKRT